MPGTLPTPFQTPVLFPFEPDGVDAIVETVEYVTNVITSHNDTEDRIALRRRPKLRLKWRMTTMDSGEAGRALGLLWKMGNRWYVPLWQHARLATGVAGLVYTVDMIDNRFDFSGKVLVWKSSGVADVMNYSASGGSTVTLTGATSFAHLANQVYVVPLGVGTLSQSYKLDRTNIVAGADVEFELDTTSTTLVTPLVATQTFRTVEVLNIHPDSPTGTDQEQWTLASERVGSDLGPFQIRLFANSPIVEKKVTWNLIGRSEFLAFRQWLACRRGRRVPLWVPTYQDDLTLVAAAATNAGSIDIAAVDFANKFLGYSSRVKIAVIQNGLIMPLVVTSVTTPSAGVERLFLETTTTAAVSIRARVSFLLYARLTEDKVSIEYLNNNVASVAASFTELPRETPA